MLRFGNLRQLSLLFLGSALLFLSEVSVAGLGQINDLMAQRESDDGQFIAEYSTFPGGRHELRHYLVQGNSRLELSVHGELPEVLSDYSGEAAAESDSTSTTTSLLTLTMAAGGGDNGGSNGGEPAPLANTLGEQRTLVLMANFQENPDDRPLSQEEARQLIFGEVSDFFYENSYQKTWLAGDVSGWFTLPLSRNTCDLMVASDAVEQAASNAGIDIDSYTRIVYLFTRTACSVDGTGTIGGSPSRARINGKFTADNIAHELGHNFGLYHSRALDCYGETLAENCNSIEYGDTYDVMGNPEFGHFTAVQKARLGWLNSPSSPEIVTVVTDGTYTIENLETIGVQPKALRIPAGFDSDTGSQVWFYLEYRQALGFDSFLAERSYRSYRGDVTHGIVVHRMVEGDPKSGTLLHLNLDTPFRDIYGYADWFDPALPVGSEYVHPDTGTVIRSEWANGDSAGVSVSFSGQACVTVPTQFGVTPVVQSGVAGSTLIYTAEIGNLDSAACGVSGYIVDATTPSNWSGSLSHDEVVLAPGESTSVTLTVTSPQSAVSGDFPLEITISGTSEVLHDVSEDIIYRVDSNTEADLEPPSIPVGLSAAESSRKVTLSWSASTDNVAVHGYRILRNGAVIAETGNTNYADNTGDSGVVYEYRVVAYDIAGNVSLQSSAVSAARSKGKGGNDGGSGSGRGKGKK